MIHKEKYCLKPYPVYFRPIVVVIVVEVAVFVDVVVASSDNTKA